MTTVSATTREEGTASEKEAAPPREDLGAGDDWAPTSSASVGEVEPRTTDTTGGEARAKEAHAHEYVGEPSDAECRERPVEEAAEAEAAPPPWSDGLIARRASSSGAQGQSGGERAGSRHGADRLPTARSGGGQVPGTEPAIEEEHLATASEAETSTDDPPREEHGETTRHAAPPARASALAAPSITDRAEEQQALARRLGALGELLGLSRGRVEPGLLAEAARVSEEAGARRRLPDAYSVVALAGATGSGKSSLFNTLAGAQLSEVGICRPTTAAPVSCTWEAAEGEGGADGLLDRLSIAQSARRYSWDESLNGLVLIDLPDHDSVAPDHRPQVDRLLGLVDAVVWVVDPEKYADALLHERYLRRMPHHADVTFVVLNQIDRLGREAVGAVLDDLRRLLDSDGVALGDYGEPGAAVLATSAHTGEGIDELRTELASLAAARRAAALRIGADLDSVLRRLRPLYVNAEAGELGLTEPIRERFDERLAVALGARAAGEAAERAWLRGAEEASATVWARLLKRRIEKRRRAVVEDVERGIPAERPGGALSPASRPAVAQAVRELGESTAAGLPEAWSRRVHDAAFRGAAGLPEALDEAARRRYAPGGAEGTGEVSAEGLPAEPHACSSVVVPEARDAAGTAQGDRAVERSADALLHEGAEKKGRGTARFRARSRAGGAAFHEPEAGRPRWRTRSDAAATAPRPAWAPVALVGQVLMMLLQLVGAVWMLVASTVLGGETAPLGATLLGVGAVGAPLLSWMCRRGSQGPARVHGSTEEVRLRRLAAGCGRSRVLEPVAAELMRYREAREQYVIATGEV